MIKFEQVESKIVTINNIKAIIDSDVALLYGVETKRINEAVKNNKDKFPEGYIIELSKIDWELLKSKFLISRKKEKLISNEPVEIFDRFENLKHSTVNPKAFTEKGLYMLATILKSQKATETTIAIIETFTKIRELSQTIKELSNVKDKKNQKQLMQKSGDIIAEILDDDLQTSETETTIELNFAILKFKHTIKRK